MPGETPEDEVPGDKKENQKKVENGVLDKDQD